MNSAADICGRFLCSVFWEAAQWRHADLGHICNLSKSRCLPPACIYLCSYIYNIYICNYINHIYMQCARRSVSVCVHVCVSVPRLELPCHIPNDLGTFRRKKLEAKLMGCRIVPMLHSNKTKNNEISRKPPKNPPPPPQVKRQVRQKGPMLNEWSNTRKAHFPCRAAYSFAVHTRCCKDVSFALLCTQDVALYHTLP